MKLDDYPAFYRGSDTAAATAQSSYLCCMKLHLTLLFLAAFVGGWSPEEQSLRAWITGAVGLMLFLAMCVAVIMKVQKYDDRWFQCRAFAENTKSNTWRFMTQHSFNRESFMASLGEIRRRFGEASKYMAGHMVKGPEITEVMSQVRALPLAERAAYYVENRLKDQRDWYLSKANSNGKSEHRWFLVLVGVEAIAILLAVFAAIGEWHLNPTGAISTLVVAGVAWAQTKRFSELATSYASTAQDLSLLGERAAKIEVEADLEQLVDEVEDTVSREHRMWLSKRCASPATS